MYEEKRFGLAAIKDESENIIRSGDEEKKSGEFEYKLSKYHLYEAYQAAKKSNELGYARLSSDDLMDMRRLYANVFCEDMPEDE